MKTTSKTARKVSREDLEQQKRDAERLVVTLKAERSSAILDGTAFDASKLRDAEDSVSAIVEAINEFDRREREAMRAKEKAEAAKTDDQRRAEARAEIVRLEGMRMKAIEDMETAIRNAADAYQRANTARGKLFDKIRGETGETFVGLMESSQENRLAEGLSTAFSSALGKGSFGQIRFQYGIRADDIPWPVVEHGACGAAIANALDKLADEVEVPSGFEAELTALAKKEGL